MAAAVEITPAIIPTGRRVPDRFRTVSGTIEAVAPLILVVIVAILFQQAAPAVRHFGLGFLAGTDWNPVTDTFGALPAIFGTVATSFVALAIALPVGVAVAVVLAEQGQTTIRGILGTGIELLAAIPSVVYGIWALYVLAPCSYQHLEVPISDRFGFIGCLTARKLDRQGVQRGDWNAVPGPPDRAWARPQPRPARRQRGGAPPGPLAPAPSEPRRMNRTVRRPYASRAWLGVMYLLTLVALIPLGLVLWFTVSK